MTTYARTMRTCTLLAGLLALVSSPASGPALAADPGIVAAAGGPGVGIGEPVLSLSPASAVRLPGETHVVTATLVDGGAPIPDAAILLTVTGVNSLTDVRYTNAAGTASFSYSGGVAGNDELLACYDADNSGGCEGAETTASASVIWVGAHAYALQIDPASETGPVGFPHSVTATLVDYQVPVEGGSILFAVVGPNAAYGAGVTGPLGTAPFTYTGLQPGEDVIQACHDENRSGGCDQGEARAEASRIWTAVHTYALALAPATASGPTGVPHSVTATLLDAGAPVAGATILFEVTGANTASGSAGTDTAGAASFAYTGVAAGEDTISACHDEDLSGACGSEEAAAQAARTWEPVEVNTPPDCSGVSATPAVLWPPDHQMRLVVLAGASDPDGDPVTISVTGVTQNEPEAGGGFSDRSPDSAPGSAPQTVYLRSERNGGGVGRIYTLAFRAEDGRGGSCSGTVDVRVPHDQRRKHSTTGAVRQRNPRAD